ncbi:G-protein coupled receptor 4-like [Mastacembelus armatus]|uniref:G-protein coupled receptor 4-like n=1 Tax=Mastacembelus armatus TaxID=205130 RepID=A0A3Q3KGR6_9TELE|nr:G-protein coupled receptor 4-like [Mastacembelus armatus]
MALQYSHTTTQQTLDPSNMSNVCSETSTKPGLFMDVVTIIIICVGLPLTLLAIYAVYSLVEKDRAAPVYVINLLISDLVQLCCMIAEVAQPKHVQIHDVFFYIYYFGVMASVGFMVCIALERYLVIACPLWYRFRRTIKISLVVCGVVWALPLFYILPVFLEVNYEVSLIIFAIFFLLPYPLFIFFLAGTLKALSAASRIPPDEKRRIVAILVLVLLTYTVLFLPGIIWSLIKKARTDRIFCYLSYTIIKFSPLADLFLYVFLRKGAVDKLLASLCCCRIDTNYINRPTA